MKYLLLLAGTLPLFCCRSSKTNDCPENEYSFEYKIQSRIDTVVTTNYTYFQINAGNKIVFIYTHIKDRCLMASDGGYSEQIVFEVPENVSSFSYTNDELTGASAYYRKSCFCVDVSARQITEGTIEGERLSAGVWRVRANVRVGTSKTEVSINNSFRQQ